MTTLIVGGYGSVGRTIAEDLATASDDANAVIIAGRDETKANAVASEFGDNVSGIAFDLEETDSYARILKDVDQVVMCVDQSGTAFVEACLESGADYVDVTASDEFFRQVEQLDDLARDGDATAVLSVGLAPGVTNLLAKLMADQLSSVSDIQIGVLLGLGEAFGPAASRWTLERISREFAVPTAGHSGSIRGFSNPVPVEFPRYGQRWAYSFDFADQHVLHRTLNVPARTHLCFDSRGVTSAVYGLSWVGLYRPAVEAIGLDRLTDLVSTLSVGGDGFAVTVEVDGQQNSTAKTLMTAIDGREQSRVTGIVAATVALAIRDTAVPDGVHHIHEILDPEPILDVLRKQGYRLTNSEQVRETREPVPPNP
ncbi:saccharopine dehydrogenase NADP-binding domain-containing protein [Halogeometricum sp. S1BR25-6]|jgi:saccharopine dehydrogenase-like NADP-dependent oxidoreductase|uniref:Saccharopine dehydrogenase NADP-binding domain-containing protein n=1 Tax=Halogeometricum salsisoli TaxID=2950536 RepID=A0ABU2GKK8_9EURY|nr:saccharopine dehydrogenase NADP-binding domain-containing protein [Halogeometricum sp. S1BR25-6]MDS0301320.1 saccharopine dehydrogenase NADP-binding domain-containing protein [Halogeometricum sp. S1BR25-6]